MNTKNFTLVQYQITETDHKEHGCTVTKGTGFKQNTRNMDVLLYTGNMIETEHKEHGCTITQGT